MRTSRRRRSRRRSTSSASGSTPRASPRPRSRARAAARSSSALPGNPSEETLDAGPDVGADGVPARAGHGATRRRRTPRRRRSRPSRPPRRTRRRRPRRPTPTAAAEEPSDEPTKAAPDNPSDTAYYITPAVQAEFDALDCTDPTNLTGGVNGDPDKAFVTCGQDGSAKYILGPVEIEGARISSATSGLNQLPSGGQGNKWVVNIAFDGQGTTEFTDVTTRLQGLAASAAAATSSRWCSTAS